MKDLAQKTQKKSSRISRNIGGIYYILLSLYFIAITIWAAFLYPSQYIPGRNYISALGGVSSNPLGYMLWNHGIKILGIALLPLIFYQTKHLNNMKSGIRLFIRILGFQASVGFILLGFFPQDSGIYHVIPAFMVLLGFSIYYHFLFYCSRELILYKWRLYLLFIFIDCLTLILLLRQVFPDLLLFFTKTTSLGFLNSVPPYEWGIFTGLWIFKGVFSFPLNFTHVNPKG